MAEHPFFKHTAETPSLDETRHITIKRMYAIYNEQFAGVEKVKTYFTL